MLQKQFEPITVLHKIVEPQKLPILCHDFYEFIYLKKGKGIHYKQGQNVDFSSGDLFFVRAKKNHSFTIIEETEFYIIRFSQSALLILKELINNSNGRAVSLSKAQSPLNAKVSFSLNEKELVESTLDLLLKLYEDGAKNESLYYFQILTLITLIERNLTYQPFKNENLPKKKDLSRALRHIHKYLREPEMLSVSYIADKFNVSVGTLGIYFKRDTGMSVKKYIQECKKQAVQKLILEGECSFSEIAHEFGFTDESHFSKWFKKNCGINPTTYKEQNRKEI
ncbi:AraC family transcriptional regulator [Chishuiella sp.]|uniref:AraC family transcriptional regulator n=1 Tax=Chishuiella sp. TaxID=1969467 RepID=UPI0028AA9EDA|nr:AraC family transcriptional regulator [Chishuiella sp.]